MLTEQEKLGKAMEANNRMGLWDPRDRGPYNLGEVWLFQIGGAIVQGRIVFVSAQDVALEPAIIRVACSSHDLWPVRVRSYQEQQASSFPDTETGGYDKGSMPYAKARRLVLGRATCGFGRILTEQELAECPL